MDEKNRNNIKPLGSVQTTRSSWKLQNFVQDSTSTQRARFKV